MARQGVDAVAAKAVLAEQPKIKLNGNSINGKSSGVGVETDGLTNRKENVRFDS